MNGVSSSAAEHGTVAPGMMVRFHPYTPKNKGGYYEKVCSWTYKFF